MNEPLSPAALEELRDDVMDELGLKPGDESARPRADWGAPNLGIGWREPGGEDVR